ncbi:CLUMA_CG017337, isoform A [Clunio marinus]|uniref:CLUMA_CG017337, isoform A n=1 Tax=Clunio marinus TaxID=568069 RepID=A0A1J1IX09_9DIPT|nr:CLUMA_CG017337, isoform A [Clunio marinus]
MKEIFHKLEENVGTCFDIKELRSERKALRDSFMTRAQGMEPTAQSLGILGMRKELIPNFSLHITEQLPHSLEDFKETFCAVVLLEPKHLMVKSFGMLHDHENFVERKAEKKKVFPPGVVWKPHTYTLRKENTFNR